jgi:hypothetical protein
MQRFSSVLHGTWLMPRLVGAVQFRHLYSNFFLRRMNRVLEPNKSLKQRAFGAGQFLSCSFVVLLRKSISQNRKLKAAA